MKCCFQTMPCGFVHSTCPLVPPLAAGGNNALPQAILESLLVGGTVAGVQDTTTAAQCGNGVCEAGERVDEVNGVAGCPQVGRGESERASVWTDKFPWELGGILTRTLRAPPPPHAHTLAPAFPPSLSPPSSHQLPPPLPPYGSCALQDCPFPVAECPSANGAACNGVGQCVSGVCLCSAEQGYMGDACDQCTAGFVPGDVAGECAVLEVTAAMLEGVAQSTSATPTPSPLAALVSGPLLSVASVHGLSARKLSLIESVSLSLYLCACRCVALRCVCSCPSPGRPSVPAPATTLASLQGWWLGCSP